MNMFKSFDINSTTLRRIENLMGRLFFNFIFLCVKFHGKLSLNVIFFSPFVGIVEMFQGFTSHNDTLLE